MNHKHVLKKIKLCKKKRQNQHNKISIFILYFNFVVMIVKFLTNSSNTLLAK